MTPSASHSWEAELDSQYQDLLQHGLQLNMTRGKPCVDEVALSDALDGILAGDYRGVDDSDVRLAPTFPSLKEVEASMQTFVVCV